VVTKNLRSAFVCLAAAASLPIPSLAQKSAPQQIYTKADSPRNWAGIMRNVARLHKDLGDQAAAEADLKAANQVDPQ
jgi:hypothetical protein